MPKADGQSFFPVREFSLRISLGFRTFGILDFLRRSDNRLVKVRIAVQTHVWACLLELNCTIRTHAAITRGGAPISRGRIWEVPEDVPAVIPPGTKASHTLHYLRRFTRARGIDHSEQSRRSVCHQKRREHRSASGRRRRI